MISYKKIYNITVVPLKNVIFSFNIKKDFNWKMNGKNVQSSFLSYTLNHVK